MTTPLELSTAIREGLDSKDPYYVVVVVRDSEQTKDLVETFKPLCSLFTTTVWNPENREMKIDNVRISFIPYHADYRQVMAIKLHKLIIGFPVNSLLLEELQYRESRGGR